VKNTFAPATDRAAAAAALDVQPLPFAWGQLWGDFLVLDARRPPAMAGISPIPVSEITAYGHALRGGYVPHEIETLIALDAIRLRVARTDDPAAVLGLTHG
jgi:hypothetical protein